MRAGSTGQGWAIRSAGTLAWLALATLIALVLTRRWNGAHVDPQAPEAQHRTGTGPQGRKATTAGSAAEALAIAPASSPASRTVRRRWRTVRRAVALGWVVLVTVTLGVNGFSLAYFTDQANVPTNSFTTGSLDLTVDPMLALLTFSNMQPGDDVTGGLIVTNGGTVELRYAMTASATDTDGKGLKEVLGLTIKTEGTGCAVFTGTTLYSGAISGAAIGNPATGAQGGERTLGSSAAERLCFRASLPTSVGNDHQTAATTVTFTFVAEQTANNP